METSASEIMDRIDFVRSAAKGEAEKLGHLVCLKYYSFLYNFVYIFFFPLKPDLIFLFSKVLLVNLLKIHLTPDKSATF